MRNPANFLNILIVLTALFISTNNIFAQANHGQVDHLFRISSSLKAPVRLAIDASDNIYVSDANTKKVLKYAPSGTLLANYGTGGSPISLAVNSDDQVFIGEEEGQILKLNGNGTTSLFYSDTIYPSDMAFSPDNKLYVVDSRSKQVIVLDATGNLIQSFGSGTLVYPTSIAYDVKNERIYVGEHGGLTGGFTAMCQVWVFDISGNYITYFGRGGRGPGRFYRIQGISMGKCGNIYVNDPYQGNISVFGENLTYITKFGVFGDSISQLNLPMDVTFDSQERIIVSSLNNGAIELFSISDTLPTSNIEYSDTTICTGDSAGIIINFTGTAPWSFTYTHDGSNPTNVTTSSNPYTLHVGDSGMYEITALSDSNFTGTCFSGYADIKLHNVIPTSSITSPDDTVCEGTIVNLGINFTGMSPWTFTYSIDSILADTITTYDTSFVLPVTAAGLYEVTSLIGNGCSGVSMTGSTNITLNPLPTSTFNNGNQAINICQGDSFNLELILTGAAPWTFNYTIDGQNLVEVNTSSTPYLLPAFTAGTYEVLNISDSLCYYRGVHASPEIIIHELPTTTFTDLDTLACGEIPFAIPITFTGIGPWDISYSYDNSSVTYVSNVYKNPYTIYAYKNGSYQILSVSDSYCDGNQNQGLANITIREPYPWFSFNEDSLTVHFMNYSEYATSYSWNFGDGQTSTVTNPSHTYASSGTYIVSLAASNECGGSKIFDTLNFYSTSIDETYIGSTVKIYPNPSSGKVYVEVNSVHNSIQNSVQLELLDVFGKILYKKIYSNNSVSDVLDLSNYSNGIYFIRLIEDKNIQTEKLVLRK